MDPTIDLSSLYTTTAPPTAVTSIDAPTSTGSLNPTTNLFGSAINTLENLFTTTTQAALNQAQTNSTLAAQAAVAKPATSSLVMIAMIGIAVILLAGE